MAAQSNSLHAGHLKATLSNGHEMPLVAFGTYGLDRPHIPDLVHHAVVNAGYRHLDCAATYQNESEVGKGIQRVLSSGIKREDLFITSKLWNTRHRPEHVLPALQQTLSDLGVSYLDLYLVHWPFAFALNEKQDDSPLDHNGNIMLDSVPMSQTWAAMEQLVDRGLVRSIGVSNFQIGLTNDLLSYARVKPVVNQIEAHPYLSQIDQISFSHPRGVTITAYSPLGAGTKPNRPRLLDDPILNELAAKYRVSVGQLTLAWNVGRGICVLPRSSTVARIDENIHCNVPLSEEDRRTIDGLNKGIHYVTSLDQWNLPLFD